MTALHPAADKIHAHLLQTSTADLAAASRVALPKQSNAFPVTEMLWSRANRLLLGRRAVLGSTDLQLSVACRLSSSLAAVLQRVKQTKELDQTVLPDVRSWLSEFRNAPPDEAVDHSEH